MSDLTKEIILEHLLKQYRGQVSVTNTVTAVLSLHNASVAKIEDEKQQLAEQLSQLSRAMTDLALDKDELQSQIDESGQAISDFKDEIRGRKKDYNDLFNVAKAAENKLALASDTIDRLEGKIQGMQEGLKI